MWFNAMQKKITALRKHQTWELVSLPKEARNIIECRWVYKNKAQDYIYQNTPNLVW